MTTASRQQVLDLYRKIFRLARKWESVSGLEEDTIKEKKYIVGEARQLFHKNKNVTERETIQQCIEECNARIDIGLHYGIPYPRPTPPKKRVLTY
ncbi:LYR motif-containing protein 1 [Hyperolius riggenbachi]|uniref:LYR motif-containing protein 1 n=1 Tax=Hyperolius riggenbachi TaxID=752182 RepID=UPI0035A2CB1E